MTFEFPAQKTQEPVKEPELKAEKLTGVNIDFFFSPHWSKEDLQKFQEKIDKSDVIVIESVSWDENTKNAMNNLSNADTNDPKIQEALKTIYDDPNIKPFELELIKQIAGTKKPILMVDIPKGHQLEEKLAELGQEASELGDKAWNDFIKGNYELAIQAMKESMALSFEHHTITEEFIKKELIRQVKKIKAKNSGKDPKEELHVLVQYGSAHRTIFHDMRKSGISTSATMGYELSSLGHDNEIMRKMYFNKDVPEALYARNLLSAFYLKSTLDVNPSINVEQAVMVIRSSLDKLSVDDLKELSQLMGSEETHDEKWNKLFEYTGEKGAIIPDTKEEIQTLLGPLYPKYIKLGNLGK